MFSLLNFKIKPLLYISHRQLHLFHVTRFCTWVQIITGLPPPDSGPELSYHRLDEQLGLLTKVWHLFLAKYFMSWKVIIVLFHRVGTKCTWWCGWSGAIRWRCRWYCECQSSAICRFNECHVWSKRNGLHGIQVLIFIFCLFYKPFDALMSFQINLCFLKWSVGG